MTNPPEIKEFDYSLTVKEGTVTLDNYDKLLREATVLADYLGQVEVTEENLAEGKRLVAKVRKKVNALDDIRKDLRREFLRPVNELADRISTINKIVTDAEDGIRTQIRGLEERRREERRSELKRIFDLRREHYRKTRDYMAFEKFLESRHLNKSVSVDSVEREMVDYMERVNKDVNFLLRMAPPDKAGEALTVYAVTDDAQGALESVTPPPMELAEAAPTRNGESVRVVVLEIPEDQMARARRVLTGAGVDFSERGTTLVLPQY